MSVIRLRTKSNLLWGLVGAMSFLVLVQGYELLGEPSVGLGTKLGVALSVGALTAVVARVIEGRLGGTNVEETGSR